MSIPLLDLTRQFAEIGDELMLAVTDVVESQHFVMGEAVAQLETAVSGFCGVSHGIACASGTDALWLSLRALDLAPGDEVITTPFTFFATAGAIVNAGGKPVFVDIEPRSFMMDVSAVRKAITPRTRAIVPVHLFGQMAAMDELTSLAEAHGLVLIEDAAQAIGARRKIAGTWMNAGQLGHAAALSFFPSKNLGCWGDGGMVVTNDEKLAQRLRLLRTHGGAKQYHHDEVGINSRLDTLQAAVLLAKLPYLGQWNRERREHASAYDDAFRKVDEVEVPWADPTNEHVYHQYTIRAKKRDELQNYLRSRDIGCAVYYPRPLHLQPCFADLGYSDGMLPVTEAATNEVLSLPVYPEFKPAERDTVMAAVAEFYK